MKVMSTAPLLREPFRTSGASALLAKPRGELAGAQPVGEGLRDLGDALLAISGDQLAHGGGDGRLGESLGLDAVEHSLRESLAHIVERGDARVGGAEELHG